jgi:hypothetical protein
MRRQSRSTNSSALLLANKVGRVGNTASPLDLVNTPVQDRAHQAAE